MNTRAAPPAPRYGLMAIALHWLLAVAVIGAFCVGVYMADLPFSPARVKLINYHKWAGLTILALTVVRLAWRLTHRPPPLPDAVMRAMPPWQHRAHQATHVALYALCVGVPLAGWAHSSAAGMPLVWFGVIPLPDLWPAVDKELAKHLLRPLHAAGAFALAGLVLLHVAAALKHQLLDRDGLMFRMIPWSR